MVPSLDPARPFRVWRTCPQSSDEFRWSDDYIEAAYIETSVQWTPTARATVLRLDPYDEGPQEVQIEGVAMTHALSGDQVREVIRELLALTPEPTDDQRVAAFRHYWEVDGFIEEP